jgi:hypothetical protein
MCIPSIILLELFLFLTKVGRVELCARIQCLQLLLTAHGVESCFAEARRRRTNPAHTSGVPILIDHLCASLVLLIAVLIELRTKTVICANAGDLAVIHRQLGGIQIVGLHQAYQLVLAQRRRPIETLTDTIVNCFERVVHRRTPSLVRFGLTHVSVVISHIILSGIAVRENVYILVMMEVGVKVPPLGAVQVRLVINVEWHFASEIDHLLLNLFFEISTECQILYLKNLLVD